MTGAKRVFTLLLVALLLLGGAFGGGVYYEMLKRRAVEKQLDELKKKSEASETVMGRRLSASRARTQLLEAALGVEHENFGMAFDRVIRAQSLARGMGLSMDAEVEELNALIVQQKPEAFGKLLNLADKLEPTPALALPANKKPAAAARPGAPAAAGAAGAEAAAAGGSATAAVQAPTGDRDFQEGREALRQAKELLLSGSEWGEIIKKLARSQVLLDESGFTELDDELSAGIKAAKSHEEARVRAAIDAALPRLRTPAPAPAR